MTGKRSRSFKCAVHHRDREVRSENDFHLITKPVSAFQRMVKLVADEYLTDERDRKYYADHYRCCPPPLFIVSVTLLELGFFIYYTVTGLEVGGHETSSSVTPVPIDSVLLYRPDRRWQAWRFVTYMVLHASWWHLIFNLLVQLVVGLPLEMVHGSARVFTVYMAGVLAGSLGTSVCDTSRQVYLVGASGGVYALLAAHIANVLLNYHNMEFGVFRLLIVFLIASFDVGFAIYHRYAPVPSVEPAVSYVAHLAGAAAGLSLGLVVLKNFQQKLHEQLVWWLALGAYIACTLFAIIFNILHTPANERFV
ncbi:protein rhomboid-like [Pollicipes pollicipes]|nr:protein rhomboid-like [Pollicipes pollicipes]XP_037094124.1 protein rhomboid-like [Pollicipes pollicipes]